MAHYGSHPTIFSNFTNDSLFAMYREEKWSRMDEYMRQALLQETVNRSAKLNGELGAPQVIFDDLDPTVAGTQGGGIIRMDRNRFVNDMCVAVDRDGNPILDGNGNVITYTLDDANIQALETVLHEDIHAWQDQIIDGTIQAPNQKLLDEYAANNFDIAFVRLADGTMEAGQQYLGGNSKNGGYYLYYLQSTERDAHRYSEMRTRQIVDQLARKYGDEASFQAYRQNLATNGYDATLSTAKLYFGTETVEQDINTTLKNQFYQTSEPVGSKVVEEAVKQEMVLSLQERLKNSQDLQVRTSPEDASAVRTAGTEQQKEAPGLATGPSNDNSIDME